MPVYRSSPKCNRNLELSSAAQSEPKFSATTFKILAVKVGHFPLPLLISYRNYPCISWHLPAARARSIKPPKSLDFTS
jgi:hypothetical protein